VLTNTLDFSGAVNNMVYTVANLQQGSRQKFQAAG
jgi:hypothetical protein